MFLVWDKIMFVTSLWLEAHGLFQEISLTNLHRGWEFVLEFDWVVFFVFFPNVDCFSF